jgi:hypothetical protein
MPAKKLRVLYEEEAQIGEMFGNLKHVFEYEKSIGFKFDDEFQAHWANVGPDLCAYKNPAFKEEKEIRFVHVSALAPEREIVPLGAIDSEGARLSNPVEVKFRIRDGVLVPYAAVDYSNLGKNAPIKEVILGPKNENQESHVELFLRTIGLKDVTVKRSRVPFR